jgi:hypothetical protein
MARVPETDVFDEADGIKASRWKNTPGQRHDVKVALINWQAIEILEGREVASNISEFRSA